MTSLFFYLKHLRTPTVIYPENFVNIPLDLAEILRISKLDWRDGEGKQGRRRREEEGEESYFVMV